MASVRVRVRIRRNHSWSSTFMPRRNHSLCLKFLHKIYLSGPQEVCGCSSSPRPQNVCRPLLGPAFHAFLLISVRHRKGPNPNPRIFAMVGRPFLFNFRPTLVKEVAPLAWAARDTFRYIICTERFLVNYALYKPTAGMPTLQCAFSRRGYGQVPSTQSRSRYR